MFPVPDIVPGTQILAEGMNEPHIADIPFQNCLITIISLIES